MRPAFRYFGGKAKIADWVISHFPDHNIYCEPCGGAASVLIAKTPAKSETFNDLNREILNFFSVLRDNHKELIRKIMLTPYHRDEYELAKITITDDPIENARLFYVRQKMSIGAGAASSGFRRVTKSYGNNPAAWDDSFLFKIAERLRSVQFENKDAIDLIKDFDVKGGLIYFDPPYILETRNKRNEYMFEQTLDWHKEAAELLIQSRSHVVVSGYAHPLYDELYEENGFSTSALKTSSTGNTERIEKLWLSPSISQSKLF